MTPEKRREGERLAAQCACDLDHVTTLVSDMLRCYMRQQSHADLFGIAGARFSAARKAACDRPGQPDLRTKAMLAGLTLVGLRYTTLEIARGLIEGVEPR